MVDARKNCEKKTTENGGPQNGKEKVEHNYRDFATETPSSLTMAEAAGPGGDPPFPVKLHYVLTELKEDGLDHVVSWQPHGR